MDFKNEPDTGNHLLHKWSLLPFIYSFDRNVLNSDYVPNTMSTMTDTNGEQNKRVPVSMELSRQRAQM